MKPLQILHLEDDAFDADLVHREVARLALDAAWVPAASGDEFRAALAGGEFDAVVSDNQVAGIDGMEALQAVRAQRPGLPFIFVSGNADPRWAERCLEAGATDYVPKNALWRLPTALRRLDDARRRQRLEALTASRAVLVDAVRDLSLARTVDEIVQVVRRAARQLNGADGATVVLRDGDLCHYVDEDAIAPLWKGHRFPMDTCISGWAMLHGQPAVIPDITVDARIPQDAYRPTFVRSLVMVPIRPEAPLGAIGNYWAGRHDATPDEVQLIQALADSTALAFEHVALVDGLEQRVRDRTAELEAANEDLEAFSYSVSHDLRAPLRAVKGYADLLSEALPPDDDGDPGLFVEHIRRAADRMDRLIEDMLLLSKVSRTSLHRTRVPIGRLAGEIVDGLRATAPDRRVVFDIDPALVAEGDSGLLHIALDNLLSNAWKFTARRPEARIAFRAAGEDAAGRQLFAVSDNGAGFDMKHASRLFQPFRRLHRESDFPGTGVGLAIVRRVLLKHGGDVQVQAAVGEGATFVIALPTARAPTPAAAG